ncbi:MAG: hypothetical protein HQK52_21110 [Oligoflexia bacterium]|nr:hypothetical protein [Oligoflexia bacterium]
MKLLKLACCLTVIFVFLPQLMSCAPKATPPTQRLAFQFNLSPSDLSSKWGQSDPSDLGEVNCFGVFITYPEHTNNNLCREYPSEAVLTRPSFMVGSVGIHETLYAEVTAGPSRRFQVVGLKSSGACPVLAFSMASSEQQISTPFLFGETTQDIAATSGEQVVSINASFNSRSIIKDCKGSLFDWEMTLPPSLLAIVQPLTKSYQANADYTVNWSTIALGSRHSHYQVAACSNPDCIGGCAGTANATPTPSVTKITGLSDGPYFICLRSLSLASATPSAWNVSPAPVVIDSILPSAPSGISPHMDPATCTDSFIPTFTPGTDTNIGPHTIQACTNHNCLSGCSNPVTNATPGVTAIQGLTSGTSYFVCARAFDLAGNFSSWAVSSATIVATSSAFGVWSAAATSHSSTVVVTGHPLSRNSSSNSDDDKSLSKSKEIDPLVPANNLTLSASNTTPMIKAVAMAMSYDGTKCSALAEGGSIYSSVDGGYNWFLSRKTATATSLSSMAMSQTGAYQTALSISPPMLLLSSDYGASWISTDDPMPLGTWKGVAMSADGMYQTIIDSSGPIYRSDDYGVTWIPVSMPDASYSGIAMSNDGRYQVATIHESAIIWSVDYGLSWSLLPGVTPGPTPWAGVAISSNGLYVSAITPEKIVLFNTGTPSVTIVGTPPIGGWKMISMSASGQRQSAMQSGSGQIFVSNDFGKSWALKGPTRAWVSLALSWDGQNQLASASDGRIHFSRDSGNRWEVKDQKLWTALAIRWDKSPSGNLASQGIQRYKDHLCATPYGAETPISNSIESITDVLPSGVREYASFKISSTYYQGHKLWSNCSRGVDVVPAPSLTPPTVGGWTGKAIGKLPGPEHLMVAHWTPDSSATNIENYLVEVFNNSSCSGTPYPSGVPFKTNSGSYYSQGIPLPALAGTPYTFKVAAVNSAGDYAYSLCSDPLIDYTDLIKHGTDEGKDSEGL